MKNAKILAIVVLAVIALSLGAYTVNNVPKAGIGIVISVSPSGEKDPLIKKVNGRGHHVVVLVDDEVLIDRRN